MAITTADEQLIRRFIGIDKIGSISTSVGRIIPAPVYFAGKEDYWATIESVSYDTQDEIDTNHIKFCAFYPKGFVDRDGPVDSPLVELTYEIYLFSQYDLERSDENISPDAFNKKMLKAHNEFVGAFLELKETFQGWRNMGILDDAVYAIQQTTSLVQNQFIENRAQCRFIPGVVGHQVILDEPVRLKLVAC